MNRTTTELRLAVLVTEVFSRYFRNRNQLELQPVTIHVSVAELLFSDIVDSLTIMAGTS